MSSKVIAAVNSHQTLENRTMQSAVWYASHCTDWEQGLNAALFCSFQRAVLARHPVAVCKQIARHTQQQLIIISSRSSSSSSSATFSFGAVVAFL
jgi:hypothetical protein